MGGPRGQNDWKILGLSVAVNGMESRTHTCAEQRPCTDTAGRCPYGVGCLLRVKMAGFKSRAGKVE